jgi:hypothetical protein
MEGDRIKRRRARQSCTRATLSDTYCRTGTTILTLHCWSIQSSFSTKCCPNGPNLDDFGSFNNGFVFEKHAGCFEATGQRQSRGRDCRCSNRVHEVVAVPEPRTSRMLLMKPHKYYKYTRTLPKSATTHPTARSSIAFAVLDSFRSQSRLVALGRTMPCHCGPCWHCHRGVQRSNVRVDPSFITKPSSESNILGGSRHSVRRG